MSDIAIRVENLSKQYRIGRREPYKTLSGILTDTLRTSAQKLRSVMSRAPSALDNTQSADTFWSLKDVSFEVKQGQVLGIIGRNGAGKSTLLRILSRITNPTRGHVRIRGRVGSLLEIGTGFHPELTGRENIYLNGAILGMKRADITTRFDEIVAFSEMEKFLETPVKHYSSGMYMRLAFAVAAHLEPDILIVDEILAVGDAAFQKKCLGKMGDVAKEGRTVLFVSHQMNQIRRLCDHCAWLQSGQLKMTGLLDEVVSSYESSFGSIGFDINPMDPPNHVAARFQSWGIANQPQDQRTILRGFEPLTVEFVLQVNERVLNSVHGISLVNNEGQLMWGTVSKNLDFLPGGYKLVYTLPNLPLRPGGYSWRLSLYGENGLIDIWDCTPQLIIATMPVTDYRDDLAGFLNIPYEFRVAALDIGM